MRRQDSGEFDRGGEGARPRPVPPLLRLVARENPATEVWAQPLQAILIRRGWQEHHEAHVVVARRVADGLAVAGFIVDLQGMGLRDSYAHFGVPDTFLQRLLEAGGGAAGWDECSLALARELVHGGAAWARLHGFATPRATLRHVEILGPAAADPDLSRFGRDGHPIVRLDHGRGPRTAAVLRLLPPQR